MYARPIFTRSTAVGSLRKRASFVSILSGLERNWTRYVIPESELFASLSFFVFSLSLLRSRLLFIARSTSARGLVSLSAVGSSAVSSLTVAVSSFFVSVLSASLLSWVFVLLPR